MTKKVFIKTYGCQMNEYDSARIVDLLKYEVVGQPDNADLILLNTCSVREKAQEKVFSDLGRYRKIKNKNPKVLIGVGGCVASQFGREIIKRAPFVNVVFGPQTLHRLPELLQQSINEKKPIIDISFPEIEKFDRLPKPSIQASNAYVTIMEGCNNYCAYCIVPYVRGKEISRPFQQIIDEVNALVKQGAQEITFLGQNVNHYHDNHYSLSDLIKTVAKIDAIKRIRFLTSHPAYFTDALIDCFKTIPKIANHIHLPIQSGSDRILMLMKRRYLSDDYRLLIQKLKSVRPNIIISSDFIVGFPDETEKDFEATLQLIHDIGFDLSYSFIYSPRPGTEAAKMNDSVPLEIKKKRLEILQKALLKTAEKISQNMLNSIQTVLVLGESKKQSNQLTGRTENNRVVNFKGNQSFIGKFVSIKINDIQPNSLRGELIDE